MSYTLEIEITGLPRMTNANVGHWATRQKHAVLWKRKVFDAAWPLRPKEPLTKAKVTYTRYSCNPPDSDGLVSGFKHCQDALVHAGVIIDDKFDVIGMPEYAWEKWPRGQGKIKIEVQEIKTQTKETK